MPFAAAARHEGEAMTGADHVVQIWRNVRARLRDEYGPTIYAGEIARLRVHDMSEGRVCVVCPNAFSRAWVEDNLGTRLRALWTAADPDVTEIIVATEAEGQSRPLRRLPWPGERGELRAEPPVTDGRRSFRRPDRPVRLSNAKPASPSTPSWSGSANIMASTAAKAVANSSAPPFNPVFFHGDYGVGKTHLLAAIAHAVGLGESKRKALWLTAEEFINGFQSALRARDVRPFKDLVRDCDVLLIDDVHFIAGKAATELEFLQTVTALIAADKQVVLASHCTPSELQVADRRLHDILSGGFVCPMQGPDLDLRRKIIDCKIAQARSLCPTLEVPETVRDFLAARVTSSARELEGVLNNIIVRTALMDRPVTIETVEEALGELPVKSEKRVTVDDIQKTVAVYFDITVEDLHSKRRTKTVVRPRHIAMYLAKTLTTRSLPDIGRRFGGRDHSTVIHAVNKITDQLPSDAVLSEDIEALRRRLRD
jgi:chromosomal replication initiator protein